MLKKTAAALFALLFATSITWATVAQWSTTPANNVLSSGTSGTGGVNIDEGMSPSGVNNAIRDIMAQLATFITAATFTGTTPITLISTDAGATAQPILALLRNSASPAASDILAKLLFQGKDSAANTEDYAEIYPSITDATSTSEDADLLIRHKIAGTMTTAITASASNITMGKPVVLSNGATATGLRLSTAAAVSGSSVDFTSLPAAIKAFTLSLVTYSTNGTAIPEIRLGDSGGLENSNYVGSVTGFNETGPVITTTQLSTGFSLAQGSGWSAAVTITGQIECTRMDASGHTWICRGQWSRTDADIVITTSGTKTLSAEFDRISVVTTDTGDNGTIGLAVEY